MQNNEQTKRIIKLENDVKELRAELNELKKAKQGSKKTNK